MSDIVDIIKQLAAAKGETLASLERKLGYGNGTISRWRKNTPSLDKVEKVADYLNVSLDFLTGRGSSSDTKSITRQIMMRMDAKNLNEKQIEEVESEFERFLKWRIEEIKRENELKD